MTLPLRSLQQLRVDQKGLPHQKDAYGEDKSQALENAACCHTERPFCSLHPGNASDNLNGLSDIFRQ